MQSSEIANMIVDPTHPIKDREFFKLAFEQIRGLADQINCKMADNQIKTECFRSLSLAMYYLAQGLREVPANSNKFL